MVNHVRNGKSCKKTLNKMESKNFTDALENLLDLCSNMISYLPNSVSGTPPYWVRCFEIFKRSITINEVENEKNKIPETDRFTKLRGYFRDILFFNHTEFSNELILEVDGKKTINDSWIKIDESESDEFEADAKTAEPIRANDFYSGRAINRGIKITIIAKTGPKSIDNEFPIAEFYNAAIQLYKSGIKQPHFPYAIIARVYECVMFASPEYPEKMNKILSDLLPYLVEETTSSKTERMSEFIKPLFRENKEILGDISSKIKEGINEIPDEDMEEISERMTGLFNKIESAKTTSIMDLISDFLPGSADEIEEKMSAKGVSMEEIRAKLDVKGTGALTNEELQARIDSLMLE